MRISDWSSDVCSSDLRESLPRIAAIRNRLPALRLVLVADEVHDGGWWRALAPAMEAACDRFAAVDTAADDPAVILYTSATTGQPKVALHAHPTLLGHPPAVGFPQAFFPPPADRSWPHPDRACTGARSDGLLTALHP